MKNYVNVLYNSAMSQLMESKASNKRFFTCEEYKENKKEISDIEYARMKLTEKLTENK